MNGNYVINIGRQLGSGGKEIGEKLAARLGIDFYDKELILSLIHIWASVLKECIFSMKEIWEVISVRLIFMTALPVSIIVIFMPSGIRP